MKYTFTFLLLTLFSFHAAAQTQVTGTQNFTYCYDNYEDSQNIYQSSNGNPLIIVFNSGTVEENYDFITIYDGNGTGIPLLQNYSGDMSGKTFTALSGFITIAIQSDYSYSCQGEQEDQLDYTISVSTCTYPIFTTSINSNCYSGIANDASVTFNVTSMNGVTSSTVTFGSQTQTITAIGSYTFTGLNKYTTSEFTISVSNDCSVIVPVIINCIVESADCSNAFPLVVGNSDSQFRVIGDNTNGFENFDFYTWDNFYCGGDYGVWFTLTVPQGITSLNIAQFEYDGSLGYALYDGYLSVFRGSCTNLTEIACEDDTDDNYFPIIELQNLIPGEQLYILAAGTWFDTGIFEIAAWNSTLSNPEFNLNNQIKLYPNPVNDVLSIQTDLEINGVEVYNLLGQNVIKNTITKQLQVATLPTGTYVIKIHTTKGTQTTKFIKK